MPWLLLPWCCRLLGLLQSHIRPLLAVPLMMLVEPHMRSMPHSWPAATSHARFCRPLPACRLIESAQATSEADFERGAVALKDTQFVHKYAEAVPVSIRVSLGGTDTQRLLVMDIRRVGNVAANMLVRRLLLERRCCRPATRTAAAAGRGRKGLLQIIAPIPGNAVLVLRRVPAGPRCPSLLAADAAAACR